MHRFINYNESGKNHYDQRLIIYIYFHTCVFVYALEINDRQPNEWISFELIELTKRNLHETFASYT